jgi:hypothetical protein
MIFSSSVSVLSSDPDQEKTDDPGAINKEQSTKAKMDCPVFAEAKLLMPTSRLARIMWAKSTSFILVAFLVRAATGNVSDGIGSESTGPGVPILPSGYTQYKGYRIDEARH